MWDLKALRSQPPLDRNIKERRYSVDVLPDIHKMSNVDNPMTRSFDGGESNSFLPTSNNKSGKHVKFDPSIDNLFEEKEDDNYFNVKGLILFIVSVSYYLISLDNVTQKTLKNI